MKGSASFVAVINIPSRPIEGELLGLFFIRREEGNFSFFSSRLSDKEAFLVLFFPIRKRNGNSSCPFFPFFPLPMLRLFSLSMSLGPVFSLFPPFFKKYRHDVFLFFSLTSNGERGPPLFFSLQPRMNKEKHDDGFGACFSILTDSGG